METNLFGEPISEEEATAKQPSFRPKKTGYAATPGTGPKGETCKSCQHYARVQHAKAYLKCLLMRKVWTHGPGTDIKAKSPACAKWEPKTEKPKTFHMAH